MAEERYPGERRGLSLFLEELLPVVEQRGESRVLLRRAIRRALDTGQLDHLRHARQLFNHLPRPERQELSAAMLGPRARPAAPRDMLLDALFRQEPAPTVSFELVAREGETRRPVRVEYRHELTPAVPVRVTIAPGTLPSVAADTLRRVAAMIEADRRLLSARFWEQGGPAEAEERDRDAR